MTLILCYRIIGSFEKGLTPIPFFRRRVAGREHGSEVSRRPSRTLSTGQPIGTSKLAVHAEVCSHDSQTAASSHSKKLILI